MSDVRQLNAEQYSRMCDLLDHAARLSEAAKRDGLTLAQKLALRQSAFELREDAKRIGGDTDKYQPGDVFKLGGPT